MIHFEKYSEDHIPTEFDYLYIGIWELDGIKTIINLFYPKVDGTYYTREGTPLNPPKWFSIVNNPEENNYEEIRLLQR